MRDIVRFRGTSAITLLRHLRDLAEVLDKLKLYDECRFTGVRLTSLRPWSEGPSSSELSRLRYLPLLRVVGTDALKLQGVGRTWPGSIQVAGDTLPVGNEALLCSNTIGDVDHK